ncbi:MAG TPA: PKD domain-containing protein, partial [Bacteroidia bacterium]|nr:PKD domain-containing protein [Bacteroidia bacterium]
MKKKLLSILTVLASGFAFGQTIPNGGFENWTTSQYEEPTGFQTSNSKSDHGVQNPGNAVKTTDAHHGTYAIQLNTISNGVDTSFAYFANGDPGQNPAGGGIPYSQKPTGIRLYYKSNIVGTDSAIILVMFKKAGVSVGSYFYKIGTTKTSYTLFNQTFSPALSATPDSVVFGAASSNAMVNVGIPGNMFQVDSISFTGVTQQPAGFNGDLELWQPHTVNFLNGWANNGGGEGITQTTDKYTGNYAVDLQTMGPSFGGSNHVEPANIITGIPVNNSGPKGGHPYTNQIDTLVFYYKYIPADPSDSASVSINFSKNGIGIGGYRKLLGTAVGSYSKVMIPFNLGTAPDTAMVGLESSSYTTWPYPNSFVGSHFEVDHMYLASQEKPVTNFSLPLTGCAGQPIQLVDSSLNMVTGWTWIMGGGTPSSSSVENPTVTYNAVGSHTISMIATNSFGNGVQVFKHITIYGLPSISVTSPSVCQGTQATLTASGANTFTWSTGANTASITVTPTTTATYTVTGTDVNGCSNNSTGSVTILTAPTPDICMVTTDSLSIYNVVYWDKTVYANVDSFIIYREVQTAPSTYKRIGAQLYDSLSQFIDTTRHVGPANGDPNAGSYRYKLQTVDTCGNYSALSPYH